MKTAIEYKMMINIYCITNQRYLIILFINGLMKIPRYFNLWSILVIGSVVDECIN